MNRFTPVSPDVLASVREAVEYAQKFPNGNLDAKTMAALGTWLQPGIARIPTAIGFLNGDAIGSVLAPSVVASPDGTEGAIYPIFKKEAFEVAEDVVAPGGNVHTSDIVMSWGDISLEVHSQQTFVEPREARMAATAGIDIVSKKLEMLRGRMAVTKEKHIATAVQTAANYGGNTLALDGSAGKYRWSDYTNSDPIVEIAKRDWEFRGRIGKRANTLLLSPLALQKLQYHPKITSLVQYTSTKQSPNLPASLELLSALTGKNIVVGEMLEAASGPDGDLTDVWDNTAALLYIGSGDIYSPQFAMTLTSSGFPQSESFKDMQRGYNGTMFYRLSDAYKTKVVVPNAGFLWTSVTA